MTKLEKLDLCSELLKDWADKVHQIRGMTTWTDQQLRLMFGMR